MSQGLVVTILAYVFGLGAALLFATFAGVQGNGVTVEPEIGLLGAAAAFVLAIFIALASAVIPAWWISRFNLTGLLAADR